VLNPGRVLTVEGAFIDAFADLLILLCPIGSDLPYEPISVAFFNKAGMTDTYCRSAIPMCNSNIIISPSPKCRIRPPIYRDVFQNMHRI
jgi:hypothetical protein